MKNKDISMFKQKRHFLKFLAHMLLQNIIFRNWRLMYSGKLMYFLKVCKCGMCVNFCSVVVYSLYIHDIFTIYSLYVHYIFTIYLLSIHYLFTIYSLSIHYLFTIQSLYIHYMFTMCSLYIHYMSTICSLYVHYMSTICSLYIHSIFTMYSMDFWPLPLQQRIKLFLNLYLFESLLLLLTTPSK